MPAWCTWPTNYARATCLLWIAISRFTAGAVTKPSDCFQRVESPKNASVPEQVADVLIILLAHVLVQLPARYPGNRVAVRPGGAVGPRIVDRKLVPQGHFINAGVALDYVQLFGMRMT